MIKNLRGGGELAQVTSFFAALHLLLFLGRGYGATSCQVPLALWKSMTIQDLKSDPARLSNEGLCQGM